MMTMAIDLDKVTIRGDRPGQCHERSNNLVWWLRTMICFVIAVGRDVPYASWRRVGAILRMYEQCWLLMLNELFKEKGLGWRCISFGNKVTKAFMLCYCFAGLEVGMDG